MSPVIEVQNLTRVYRVPVDARGLGAKVRHLLRPSYEERVALNNVTFDVQSGEILGYIGPNGAGKSTTIKVLTGLLTPTRGEVRVLGMHPHQHRTTLATFSGVLMGQRSQLWWDLPVVDSFDMLRLIYNVPAEDYLKRREQLVELMDLQDLLSQPVRLLSLGQRMRAEIIATFLHRPRIVYLDEPTIGLDVFTKQSVLEFLLRINAEDEVTIVLTTHDMGDVERVCRRILLLDEGTLRFDGSIDAFMNTLGPLERVRIEPADAIEPILPGGFELVERTATSWTYLYDAATMSQEQVMQAIAQAGAVVNVSFSDPDLSVAIRALYAKRGDFLVG